MPETNNINKIQQLEKRVSELEEELRSARNNSVELRLKRAELASGTGNWELHLDTKVMYGSEGALRLYGLKDTRMDFEDVRYIPLPEYRPLLDKALQDLINENKPYNIEFRIRNKETGEILDIHSTAEYDRKNHTLFGVIHDITSQKVIEEELRKRSETLAVQLEISMYLLEKADKRSVLRNLLEGANKLVGLNTAAVYSIDGEHLILESTIPPLPDDFPDEFRLAEIRNHTHINKALNMRQPLVVRDVTTTELSAEEKVIIENRGMRSLLYIPLIATGRNYGIIILGSLGEIHEFTENEIAICRTISNIASLALENSILISNLKAAKEKAEESDRLKTAFLHNISHEIRTPLNAIIGFSGFLEQTDLSETDRKKYIDIINQSNTQLLSIINDIFNLSHIEAGQVMLKEEKTDVPVILNNLYNQYLPLAASKGLQLKLDISGNEDNCCNIISDEGKLIQILSNLLNNALKFTPAGTITLGCSKQDRKIRFYVEDTGIGISEKEIRRIFERFYQVEKSSAENYSGAGLGLSISEAYVRLMGGEIKVESTPGKGSRFWFEVPCIPSGPIAVDKVVNTGINSDENKTKTILIAEDDNSNAKLLELYLRKMNARTVVVTNGLEAVDFCRQEEVDLVLMDIKMPLMDGYSATTEIRKIKPDLNIIAQTAYSTASDKLKAMNSGCTGFISKPINKNELLTLVNKYLFQ
jgi:signal transduction histidine kinase